LKVLLMQDFQTAASVLKHRLPHSAKPHPRILPQRGKSLKVLLMQDFQTAASVLKHRLPHSAKPHPRILPQRGISLNVLMMCRIFRLHLRRIRRAAAFGKTAFTDFA